ncbi:hypothetical protein ACPOL_1021 [Acidisarcina polymorpha]|uniref:Uncharacterized protein n=1 Tax=Acidisarcina polymorpha TaxID=2211140 RepID=A0A2Z5FUG3_9BACT|nr:hypothetical protein ACPOL_1021 [Acidisarcina polymorpha]
MAVVAFAVAALAAVGLWVVLAGAAVVEEELVACEESRGTNIPASSRGEKSARVLRLDMFMIEADGSTKRLQLKQRRSPRVYDVTMGRLGSFPLKRILFRRSLSSGY